MSVLDILFEITVYSTILFSAIIIFKAIFRKRISPGLSYMIWFLLIARLMIPVTLNTGFSFFVIPTQPMQQILKENVENAFQQPSPLIDKNTDTYSSIPTPVSVNPADKATTETIVETISGPQVKATKNTSILWNQKSILIALWLTGTSFFIACAFISFNRLNHSMKQHSMPLPYRYQAMADVIKNELGIRKNISVRMVEGFTSPAINASLFPSIFIPREMIFYDDKEKIEYALRHEFTHYKRKDHLVCLLLLALRCVYWFHPVVWIVFELMRLDMEIACDSTMVGNMDIEYKRKYATVILSMFTLKSSPRYVLSMAAIKTRKMAEHRIEGIFKKTRSKGNVRITATLMAVILFIICFTTACQPTPEKDSIINKQGDSFLNNLSTPATDGTLMPATETVEYTQTLWQDTVEVKPYPITVRMDAAVRVPKSDQIPVVLVTPQRMTQQQIDGFLSPYSGAQYHLNTYIKTKEDYQNDIVRLQAGLAKMLVNDEYTDQDKKDWQQQCNTGIKLLQQDMVNAPEAVDDIVPAEFTNQYIIARDSEPEHFGDDEPVNPNPGRGAREHYESTHTEAIDVTWDWNGTSMALYAMKSDLPSSNKLRFVTNIARNYSSPASAIDALSASTGNTNIIANNEDILALETTYAQARAQAEEIVNRLGIDYMDVALSAKEIAYNNLTNNLNHRDPANFTDFDTIEYQDRSYVFFFTRSLAGVTENYCSNVIMFLNQYDEPWPYEHLRVVVDDTGVTQMVWASSGSTLGDTLSDDAQLLPEDQILAIARQQFERGNIGISGYNTPSDYFQMIQKMDLDIDRVELGYSRVKLSDGSGRYALVPVWDFYGSYVSVMDNDSETTYNFYSREYEETVDNFAHSFLTINAIDGSVIDRSLGY